MTIGDEKVRRYEPRMIGIEDRPYEAGMYVSLHGHYVLHSAYAELAAVPAGYVLVPVEPTQAMLDAGHAAAWRRIPSCLNTTDVEIVYRSMLATANKETTMTNYYVRETPDGADVLNRISVTISALVCTCYEVSTAQQIVNALNAQAPPAAAYNEKQIAWELERTALGDGFYGNALRVAKDLPGVTADDRALLDKFATGNARSTDHVRLQELALRLYPAPPAAVPADQEPITAGPRNYYGSLEIRCKDDVPEWCVENYSGHHWEPCPRPVYDALLTAALAAKEGE